jgi:hypothetical protein
MSNADKDLRTLDVITTEAGLVAMDEPSSTEDDRRWARDVVASARLRIAELRRGLLPAVVPIRRIETMRPGLAELSRDALVAVLSRLTDTLGAQVQYCHRNLDALSDNDLRLLIQVIESSTTPE